MPKNLKDRRRRECQASQMAMYTRALINIVHLENRFYEKKKKK
jgi:hypothetical protein